MKGSSLVASKAALALLAADAVFADVLTTIDPCPSATGLAIAPITVTSQYQAVSTCQPTSACVKGKCSTAYGFTTYPYVSTVVPYAWDGTTSQSTTVTDVSQPVRVSEYLETLTQVTAAPTLDKRWGFGWGNLKEEVVESVTVYETVTRRAMAPFKDCGRLPIPGWEGSGLCEQCESSGSQLLDVVECRFGTDASGDEYGSCSEWYETLYERVAPTTTAEARCSSSGNIPSAGVYTWTFPQPAAPVTVTAPPTTVTVYIEEQPSVTVIPAEIQVVQGESWNAYVTKTFAAATIFDFEIYITQPIVYAPFPATWAAPSTAAVSVPTGSSASKGSWPLPEQAAGGNAYSSASTVWADWTPAPTGASTSGSGSGASTSSNNIGPISASTSSATSSNIIGPISASTSTSSSSTGSATSTSSSSSSTASTSSTTGSSSTTSSSSSSSVTSTSSLSSSSSSSSTSTTTTTTGGTPVTIGVGFYLEIVATPVVRVKRQDVTVQYLAFDANNEGIAVQDQSSAALVFDGEGNALISDGMFLGTPAGDTSLVERTSALPVGFHEWYFVGQTAQLQGTAGFCLGANDTVTAYVAGDICNNPIFLAQQNSTTSSTTSSSTTSAASSTGSSNATTTASGASSSTATSTGTASSTSSTSASVGPISASTSSASASSTASSTGSSSSSTTGSGSSSVTGSSTMTSTTSSTSSGLTISVSVGPISLTTSSSNSGTATATTSSTSSSSTPICNINANICPNSELITANTVATSDCAVGLTCTVNNLAELVPNLLTQDPSIATVLLGNNQVIGLSITPQDVQAAIANNTLTGVCSALEEVTVQIDDPTCISGTATTSSSSTTAAATSTSSSSTSSSSSSMVTSTTSATTTTDQTSSTTSTTTSASASSSLLCGVQIALCAGQTLQDIGLNTVTCGTTGTVCDASQVVEAASNACIGNCESFGSVLTTADGTTTANTDPVIGTQSIQAIQAQENTGCTPSNQTVTLSQPGCPLTLLKRRTEFRHARARYAY